LSHGLDSGIKTSLRVRSISAPRGHRYDISEIDTPMKPIQKNNLYLVRHGENPANINKVFSSRIVDQSLTAKGVMQAQQTAAYFDGLGIRGDNWVNQTVYCSPLKRAHETALIIANRLNLKVSVMEAFREIRVGTLEQTPTTQADWSFHQKVMDDWFDGLSESGFPGGENYSDLWRRMKTGLLTISQDQPDQKILIVGHGGIMSATLKDLCPDVDVNWLRDTRWDNCAVTKIDLERSGDELFGTLVRWNDHDHLSGDAAELIPGVPEEI
jgi:broad specificity phosphatase PhoE